MLCSSSREYYRIAEYFSTLRPVLVPCLTIWGEKTYCLWPVSDRLGVACECFSVIPALLLRQKVRLN